MNNFLSNISLKAKLQILTFLPVILLFYFVSITFFNSFNKHKELEQVEQMVHLVKVTTEVINEQSLERDLTLFFINKDGENETELFNKRKVVDEKYSKLLGILKNNEKIPLELKTKVLKEIPAIIKNLNEVRAQIRKNNLNKVISINALNFYTTLNSTLQAILLDLASFTSDAKITKEIVATYNFLASKDDSELIKAFAVNLINELDNENEDEMLKNISYNQLKLNSLLDSQDAKLKIFFRLISSLERKQFLEKEKEANLSEYNDFINTLIIEKEVDIFQGEDEYLYELSNNKTLFLEEIEQSLLDKLKKTIKLNKKEALSNLLIDALIAAIVLMFTLFIGFKIFHKINNDMKLLKGNLLDFFDFVSKRTEDIQVIDVDGKDEFAVLINSINKEVLKAKEITSKDNQVLKEIDGVINKIEYGFFTFNVNSKAGSDSVEALKNSVNNMIDITKNKLEVLKLILDAYGKYKYNFRLDEKQKEGISGNMGSLNSSLIALGDDISIFLATFNNAIDKLNSSTSSLTEISDDLNLATNSQANYLEKTENFIKDITNSLEENSSSILKMSNISEELKTKSELGTSLANNTSLSMNEINQKVTSINDAIEVIDQIAFQTNILSLNAAVEASTAGEAGKGFAVVAQEVRNLANRSAEAAKEIKKLVEDASNKSKEGQEISKNMINGYLDLNEKVKTTKEIIDEVTQNSLAQSDKIKQINSSLDNLSAVFKENEKKVRTIEKNSKDIDNLSKTISATIEEASFNEDCKDMTKDFELVQQVANLKRYHIQFKDESFEKLKEMKVFDIADTNACEMGLWLKEQENLNKEFVKSNTWSELKQSHEQIHKSINEYIQGSSQKDFDENYLKTKASQIEEETNLLFDKLNEILKKV